MRFRKVKVLEKPRRNSGYLEDKLNEFIAMGVPYAIIEFDEGDYVSGRSCTSSYKVAIRRYDKTDILECKTINGKPYLINKKIVNSMYAV